MAAANSYFFFFFLVGKILIFFGVKNRKLKKEIPTRHIYYHQGAPSKTIFFKGWPYGAMISRLLTCHHTWGFMSLTPGMHS